MENETTVPVFDGATHRKVEGGEPVKATQWVKDGDHPLVERYPIEGREYKGLLVVNAKQKFALRFGEWILADAKGRMWVESLRADEKGGLWVEASPPIEKYIPITEQTK